MESGERKKKRKEDRKMTGERFNGILKNTISRCMGVLTAKSEEYASDCDRLHNFKVAAELQGVTPITALAGMMAKHTVSVYDLVAHFELGFAVSRELWDEKIGDSINYLLLLTALLEEEYGDESEEPEPGVCADKRASVGDDGVDDAAERILRLLKNEVLDIDISGWGGSVSAVDTETKLAVLARRLAKEGVKIGD